MVLTENNESSAVIESQPQESRKSHSIKLEDDEIAILEDMMKLPEFEDFELSRRNMLRYVIKNFKKHHDSLHDQQHEMTQLKKGLTELRNYFDLDAIRVKDLIMMLVTNKKGEILELLQSKKPRNIRSLEDAEKEGRAICQVLGGEVNGNGECVYTAYKVTPSGKAIDFPVTVKIEDLTELNVKDQYLPSKSEYEQVKLKTSGIV